MNPRNHGRPWSTFGDHETRIRATGFPFQRIYSRHRMPLAARVSLSARSDSATKIASSVKAYERDSLKVSSTIVRARSESARTLQFALIHQAAHKGKYCARAQLRYEITLRKRVISLSFAHRKGQKAFPLFAKRVRDGKMAIRVCFTLENVRI